MEFFRFNRNIPFMSWRRPGAVISIVTFLLSIFFIATKGLNLGVDFTGGTTKPPTSIKSVMYFRILACPMLVCKILAPRAMY